MEAHNLACAILCGGLATRLHPITEKIPKSLISVNGRPFLAHQLELLRARGIRRAVLCTGFLGEMIRNYAGDGSHFGLELSYSFDGPSPLGTGGAICKALPLLGESFFVLYGDSYLLCDYNRVARAFQAVGKKGLMTIYRNEGRYDRSNVEARDGRIINYDKRNATPAMEYIDYGLGVFHRSVFENFSLSRPRDLADVYQRLVTSRQLASCVIEDRFYEIGSREGIADLEEYLAGHAARRLS